MMESLFMPYFLCGFIGAFGVFSTLWLIQYVRKDAGWVDVGWTLGVGSMAIYLGITGQGWWGRRLLIAALGGVWAFRLVSYIIKDRLLSGEEDGRYQNLRAHWGQHANRNFYFFFTSQSLLVVLFAVPFVPAVNNPVADFRLLDAAGLAVCVVALSLETLCDRQLQRFRRRPENRGKTCRDGWWKYSRHPNYFFEWVYWLGFPLIAVGGPHVWLALAGPVLILLFLLFLTGIPYTEKRALQTRGDDYREYQRTTSKFIPLPPRR